MFRHFLVALRTVCRRLRGRVALLKTFDLGSFRLGPSHYLRTRDEGAMTREQLAPDEELRLPAVRLTMKAQLTQQRRT
jgi:hypothetical protein